MNPTQNPSTTAVVTRFVEAFNERDIEALDELLTPDFVDHHVPAEIPAGPAGAALWWQVLGAAFTMHLEIEDTIECGDRVASRATLRGRHIGDFGGLPATGRDFVVTMMSIERIVGGRVAERWETVDGLALLEQLGFMPDPA